MRVVVSNKTKNKQIIAVNAIYILKSTLKTRTIVPNMKKMQNIFLSCCHIKYILIFLKEKRVDQFTADVDITSNIK